MEVNQKSNRIKMGLLRQKQVQHSTEKSPLIKNEDLSLIKHHSRFSDDSSYNKTKPTENLTAEKLSIKTQKPIRKNAEGQKIVTLQRGLLQISSSTSINESSFSREASMDSLGSSHSTHIELTLGFLLAIFGVGLMYGLTGVFVRLADESGVGAAETLFVTSAFQAVVFGILICVKQKSFQSPRDKFWLTSTITVAYAVATVTSFHAFNVIPPGNAIATRGGVRMIFCIILAFLIIREKVSIKDLIAIVVCLAGISCILASSILTNRKDDTDLNDFGENLMLQSIYGYVLITSAGITRSLGMILVRKMKGEVYSFAVVVYHSTLTLFIAFILLFIHPLKWPPTGVGVGFTMAVCACSSVATWSSNKAAQLIHPALVSMGQNTDMIVSITLGHTVLHLVPSFLELFGASLILFSVTGMAWIQWRKSKHDEQEKFSINDKD